MPEDFDTILDRCLADIAAGRETIHSCLRRYPAQAGRLAALLELAERLPTAPVAALPDDQRRALESRLLKRAAQSQSQARGRLSAPRRLVWRRSLMLALVIVAAVLLGSAVGASAGSVPGDVLYPLKRSAEQVQLALTPEEQQVDVHLELAQRRLQELEVLQQRGEVVEELLTEVAQETGYVLERTPALPQERQQLVLTRLTGLQEQHVEVLEMLAVTASGKTRISIMNALTESASKRDQVKALLTGATPAARPSALPTYEAKPSEVPGTRPAQGPSTLKPSATAKDERGQPTLKPPATAKPTKAPPPAPAKPTPRNEQTPPGQAEKPTKEPKK